MSKKSEILQALEQNRDTSISGEMLAQKIGASRAYVWKAIQQLKEEGYNIQATQNKGYILLDSTDVISSEGIKPFLLPDYQKNKVITFKVIDSTNLYAKKLSVEENVSHGTIIISEEQTKGRGRLGRNFYSPKGLGIYMSIILRLNVTMQDSILITTAASVAVSRAIKKVTNLDTQIKWVNDIYLNHKKICGILTEAITNIETGAFDSIVLGIGINFLKDASGFPEEIRNVADSLFIEKPANITRNQLCAEIINEVLTICDNIHEKEFLKEYKEKSLVLHQKIMVISQDSKIPAIAIDIDEFGGLIVEYENGTIETLNSGEISIRRITE